MRRRRVDDQLLYYNYTPKTVKREAGRDTLIVAEAIIYDEQMTARALIKVRVTAQELVGMTVSDAISKGEAVRERVVAKHRTQLPQTYSGERPGTRTVVYDLAGNEIEREEWP
jgi:hypothetical protein